MPTLLKKSDPRIMPYLHGVSNTKALWLSILMFPLNSGRRRSLSLTTVLTVICSARVFMPLFSFTGFPCTGNADFLIRVLIDPESRRTLRKCLLLTVPIVLTAIVAGVYC